MTAQCLESVMKNGRIAALLKAREKLTQRSSGLIAYARQVRDGEELKRCCRNIHAMALSCSIETEAAIRIEIRRTFRSSPWSWDLRHLDALRSIDAYFRQIREKMRRTSVYVVLAHVRPHPFHASDLFFLGHLQRAMNRFGYLLHVIGIHEQRVRQFVRGPRKRAQHQHSPFVRARRNEFLGHQIHAVMQRSD